VAEPVVNGKRMHDIPATEVRHTHLRSVACVAGLAMVQ
jgi:hypothetical protein